MCISDLLLHHIFKCCKIEYHPTAEFKGGGCKNSSSATQECNEGSQLLDVTFIEQKNIKRNKTFTSLEYIIVNL